MNLLIVGGQLSNKGAESMVFSIVNHFCERKVENITLWSDYDYLKPKNIYTFDIYKNPSINTLFFMIINGVTFLPFVSKAQKKEINEYSGYIDNITHVVDCSGYGLGDYWGWKKSVKYLLRLMIMIKNKKKVYILPQSVGPFNGYPIFIKVVIKKLTKYVYNRCEKVYIREKTFYKYIHDSLGIKGAMLSPDLVLQTENLNLNNIFCNSMEIDFKKKIVLNVNMNSIAIIPNKKNMDFIGLDEYVMLYKNLVNELVDRGLHVYILYHSNEDKEICNEIAYSLKSFESVEYIDKELNSIEFSMFIRRFKLIIGSRYHSIIHAYKQGIPAIIIGWAEKYYELAVMFEQEKYYFDLRYSINQNDLINQTLKLYKCEKSERLKIGQKVKLLQTNNVLNGIG